MISRRSGALYNRMRSVFEAISVHLDYGSQQSTGNWHIARYFRSLSVHETPQRYRTSIFGHRLGVERYSHANGSCSKCGQDPSPGFKCSQCGALILPPRGTTFFDILGQEMKYDLVEGDLKKIYRKLQTEFHPDKYSQKDDLERQKSEEISSIINKAYFTLVNPYERGMYLLELHRFPVNEGDIQLGSEFLAQIMELNEDLESISTKEQLEQFENSNEIEIQKLSANVSEAFLSKNFGSAKSDLNKMKYLLSIKNRLKEMQRNL